MDSARFIHHLESAYRRMWARWCGDRAAGGG
jgi:hypothetical protein